MKQYTLIILLAFSNYSSAGIINTKFRQINISTNVTSHLEYPYIKKICGYVEKLCKSNDTKVCTVRRVNDAYEYRSFENSCFLFMSNMCENPGKEYAIVQSGACDDEVKARRMYVYSGVGITTTQPPPVKKSKSKTALRDADSENDSDDEPFILETAHDGHKCPKFCHDEYSPVCITANRGGGKAFRFWTFLNHCKSDLYYCDHWEEFAAPNDGVENLEYAPLGWSTCGAAKYLQFSRFSEETATLGHYGWLAGNYKFSHIMEPHERKPGYG